MVGTGNIIGTGNNMGKLMNKSKFCQDAMSYTHGAHRLNNMNRVEDELIKSSSGSEGDSENEYGSSFREGRKKKHGQGSSSSQYDSL